jgi:arsenate reductase-like glutaredoxin family protein
VSRLIQSDLFWDHLKVVVKLYKPLLVLLRVSDKRTPAMDQLYFYVRKMDESIGKIKEKLNELELEYDNIIEGQNFTTQMLNYFLRQKEKRVSELIYSRDDEYDSDGSDDISSLNDELEDDMESENEREMGTITESNDDTTCGSIVEKAWIKRSKALRTDIAIAGWMCSPIPEVMQDCYKNHIGDHRTATTRLYKQWFGHEVCIFYIFICFAYYLPNIFLFRYKMTNRNWVYESTYFGVSSKIFK